MVVFTCGHCGESVNKPKVEKHYMTKCRNLNPNLSCMDCFKDFLGKDYEAHTKCITEEQRYSGKGFVAKEKKGEKKQTAWVEIVQSVLDEQKSAPKNVLRIIETISKHNNTPRKKPKFVNFVKNVCGNKTSPKDIDQAWDIISIKLSELSLVSANQNKNTNDKTPPTESNAKNDESESKEVQESPTNGEEAEEDTEDEEKAKVNGDVKKLSKKQKKEEKKRKKYEAELQSAAAPVSEEEVAVTTKKEKRNKNKSESEGGETTEAQPEGKKKNKKRKRQDTVNEPKEAVEVVENIENEPVNVKVEKKKKKLESNTEADESVCLHDQNVANSKELIQSDKFNWHAVIMSVLQKKDNELPFKRLQKKVLAEYSEATGRDVDDRIADKFIKKLKSAPNVRVDKNRVTLID